MEDYFARGHNATLTGIDQPCIIVGSAEKPEYFPSGLCHILPGQSFAKRLPPQAQVDFDKLQSSNWLVKNGTDSKQIDECRTIDKSQPKRPLQILDKIATCRGLPEVLDFHSTGRTKIEALRLSFAPQELGELETSTNNPPFILSLAQIGNGPSLCRSLRTFIIILQKKAKDLAIEGLGTMPSNICTLKLSETEDDWRQRVKLNKSGKDKVRMVLAIIDAGESNKRAYEKVKALFAIEYNLQSSCISISTLKKAHSNDTNNELDEYAGALLRKVLAKAQAHASTSHKAVGKAHAIPSQSNDTVLVGFHVAHLPLRPESTKARGYQATLPQP